MRRQDLYHSKKKKTAILIMLVVLALIASFLTIDHILLSNGRTSATKRQLTSQKDKSSHSNTSQSRLSSATESSSSKTTTTEDTTTDFKKYDAQSGHYFEDVMTIMLNFSQGTGTYSDPDNSAVSFKMTSIHAHADGSYVVNVSATAPLPFISSTVNTHYAAFLVVPADVILSKNYQTGAAITDISETSLNRIAVGFTEDGKNYNLSNTYNAFSGAEPNEPEAAPLDVLYRSEGYHSSPKIIGG